MSASHIAIQLRISSHLQRRTVLVPASDKKSDTERPGHYALLSFRTLTESQRQIAYALRAALNRQRLGVVEGV
jgi:hypothetical protein